MKKILLSLVLTSMLFSSIPMFTGCGAVIVGGAGAGGYYWAKHYRECPYCKKQIRKDASVCPYCQRAVTPIPKNER